MKTVKNGKKKDAKPMERLSLKFFFMRMTSVSAPARNVRKMPPKVERKIIQSWMLITFKFPAITPKTISTIATDIPNRKDMRLAKRTTIPRKTRLKSA
ncbi:hypothetical protein GCM10025861_24060 [Methanobacterium petrolearium]|nr:hypothetical protein GCM10025861_24060 [Methanobacterium petrolearium]